MIGSGGQSEEKPLPIELFNNVANLLSVSNPKLLIGFSDITALHMAFAARAGFTTIHGPNASSSWGRFSWDGFRAVAFDGAIGDMLRYIYTDERATLGHYVEHVWMSPDLLAQMRGIVPAYPPLESPS